MSSMVDTIILFGFYLAFLFFKVAKLILEVDHPLVILELCRGNRGQMLLLWFVATESGL